MLEEMLKWVVYAGSKRQYLPKILAKGGSGASPLTLKLVLGTTIV